MIKIGINGFGRIGRSAFKVALDNHKNEVDVVALNDLTDSNTLAHLLKYDTAYGVYDKDVSASGNNILVDGKKYPVYSEKDPSLLPWRELGVDVVIESTGFFTSKEGSMSHIKAGAKRVVISAPAENAGTYLIGVNEEKDSGEESVINNASCTTNNVAPVAKIMHEKFGVQKSLMT